MGRLADFLGAQSGNIAVMFALMAPIGLFAAAFAVDEGALYLQKRQLQAAVDLAAIDAAGDPARAAERAHQSLVASGHLAPGASISALTGPDGPLRVETGRYAADPGRPAGERFVPGAAPANAVRVGLRSTGRLHFARGFMPRPPGLWATGLASADPQAGLTLGSGLVRLEGGIANALLGQLLGASLSLDAVHYSALADLDIAFAGILDALAGEAGLSAGTYDEVLGSQVRLRDLVLSIRTAAAGADPVALEVLSTLSGDLDDRIMLEMVDLVALGGAGRAALGTPIAAGAASVSALEVISAAAILADGERQASLALGAALPGLAGIDLDLVVGERPQGAWFAFGRAGTIVRTAQVRMRLDVTVLGHGGAGIGAMTIRLPIHAEIAPARAELESVFCLPGQPQTARAGVSVTPGVLRLAIGEAPRSAFLDTRAPLDLEPARIIDLIGLARVDARADLPVEEVEPHPVTLTHADAQAGTVHRVSTGTPLEGLTRGLFERLDLDVRILGLDLLGILGTRLANSVGTLLVPVAPAIDAVLVTVLDVLGISVGTADLRALGFECRSAVLVQ
ncbi:pilus assembly protein TadG-related protein [Pelagibacterium montanilacus]|uniref:pilus assembly protein TadG-related protein n=1 Tax=Pelagibacterium montanilacus TaxID=2185280 RepID=UPI000F8F7149|nr:pilus assembly protein TadG-related protein [Pelagibacterium montanilacus]